MAARKHIGRILEECCTGVVQKVVPGVKEGFDLSVPWSLVFWSLVPFCYRRLTPFSSVMSGLVARQGKTLTRRARNPPQTIRAMGP
jgi:hypothetical protein